MIKLLPFSNYLEKENTKLLLKIVKWKLTSIYKRSWNSCLHNIQDEAMWLIGLHVSKNLLFHLEECTKLKQSWDKLASAFGNFNEFYPLELETKLSTLVPNEHASIEDYLGQFISLLSQLKACGKEKNEVECISFLLCQN